MGCLISVEELRNQIYETLLLDQQHAELKALPLLTRVQSLDGITSPRQVEDWTALQRQAYGLTQVCRQIRAEILHIYRAQTKIRIDIRDLRDYLFEVLRCDGVDPIALSGNIAIDITAPCRVDLQDILVLHDSAPNLYLSFTHPEKESDMMSILLDAHRWPDFHAYISHKTSRVVLDIDFDDFLVLCGTSTDSEDEDGESELQYWPYPWTQGCVLFVKEGFVEQWMCEPIVFERWRTGSDEWESALGLKDRKKVRCPIRPQK